MSEGDEDASAFTSMVTTASRFNCVKGSLDRGLLNAEDQDEAEEEEPPSDEEDDDTEMVEDEDDEDDAEEDEERPSES